MRSIERGSGPASEAASRSSRFKPPRLMQHLLPRSRLIQQLKDNQGVVTVLIGPPGAVARW